MRVLHLIRSADPKLGGPIEGARQLDLALSALGHEVIMVTLDSPRDAWLKELPVASIGLGPARGAYGYSTRLPIWLRQHAKSFDAVIVDGLWQYPGAACSRALRGTGVPYFVFAHGALDPWFRKHHPIKHLKKQLYWILKEHRVLGEAARVLFTSKHECISARDCFHPYQIKEHVISHGTSRPSEQADDYASQFLTAFPSLSGKRKILFLGRLHKKKGCDLLIKAFAEIAHTDPSLQLVMAGPDQIGWKTTLVRLAGDLGIQDRITWTGMLQGSVKWGAICSAEVFVLPSHQENFGIAVAESLAMGTPVLISNKIDIWQEILEDEAGLIEEDTLQGTSALLSRWCSLAESKKHEMRLNAACCFDRRFKIQTVANNLVNLILEERQKRTLSHTNESS